MLNRIDFDGFSVFLDPEPVFWATSTEQELPENVERLWLENRNKLQQDIARYRSEVSIRTVYIN